MEAARPEARHDPAAVYEIGTDTSGESRTRQVRLLVASAAALRRGECLEAPADGGRGLDELLLEPGHDGPDVLVRFSRHPLGVLFRVVEQHRGPLARDLSHGV